jgi:hypothetical protein
LWLDFCCWIYHHFSSSYDTFFLPCNMQGTHLFLVSFRMINDCHTNACFYWVKYISWYYINNNIWDTHRVGFTWIAYLRQPTNKFNY